MKLQTLRIRFLGVLLAAGPAWPGVAAAEPAGDTACSAERALALVKAADEAAGSQRWQEARRAYDRAEAALRELATRCPGRLADRAETLLASLPAARAPVDEGLVRTVCPAVARRAGELDGEARAFRDERKDWPGAARLFGEAEAAWSEAAEVCAGESRQAAAAARVESGRARARAAEQVERPACRTAFADAERAQAGARTAWEAGGWQEAARLYREAEKAWTGTASACAGSRRIHAGKAGEAAGTAADEVIRCGPAWARVTELAGRYRLLPASVSADTRLAVHHRLEIYWGQAADSCRGTAAAIALAQAGALARERGKLPLPPLSVLPLPKEMPVAAPAGAELPEMTARVGDTVYAGRFRRDPSNLTLSGRGKLSWDNGNVFQGTLVLGQAEGQGSMVWANGDRYEGPWKLDLPQGQGRMDYGDGSRYEGEFVAGRPEGAGRLLYGNGERYEGGFRNGLPEGWGSYFWKGGERFEGTWKEGRKDGPGRMVWPNGDAEEVWYENDRPAAAPGQGK